MKRLIGLLVGSFFAVALTSGAGATPVPFGAFLNGPQESPPNASPGLALATLWLGSHTLTVQITFSNLMGVTTASHIYCCVPAGSVTSGVAVPNFSNLPLGATSGSFSQTLDLSLASTYDPSFETANGGTINGAKNALIAGLYQHRAYLDIATNAYPGGEIRGFIGAAYVEPVPEPASLALLGAGLIGIYAARLRRRQPSQLQMISKRDL